MKTIKIKPTTQASALDTTVRLKLKSPFVSNELIIKVTKPAQQTTFEPYGEFMWRVPTDMSTNTDLYNDNVIPDFSGIDGAIANAWYFEYAYYNTPNKPESIGSGSNIDPDYLCITTNPNNIFELIYDNSQSTGGTGFNLKIIDDAIIDYDAPIYGEIRYKSSSGSYKYATFVFVFKTGTQPPVEKSWIDLDINYPVDMPECTVWMCHPGLFGPITRQSQLNQLKNGQFYQMSPDTTKEPTFEIPLPVTINGATANSRLTYTGEIDIYIYVSFHGTSANIAPNCTSLYISAGAINQSYDVNINKISAT